MLAIEITKVDNGFIVTCGVSTHVYDEEADMLQAISGLINGSERYTVVLVPKRDFVENTSVVCPHCGGHINTPLTLHGSFGYYEFLCPLCRHPLPRESGVQDLP